MDSSASILFQSRDPYIAMRSVTAQFENLLQAAGSPLAEPAAAALNHIAGGLNALTAAAREHPTVASGGLLASIGAGGAVAYQGLISAAARFGILAPETAARWGLGGLAGSAATVPALVAGGGAALSYHAATMVRDNPDAFQGTVDNPMLGALSGDYALAQAIMHPPERKDEITVKVEVAPAEGFWARAWAMFRNPNGSSTTTVRSTGSVGRSMPEAGAFDNGGMPQP